MAQRRQESVIVVNRTSVPISYMFDGAQYVLEPGENAIPIEHVEFAKTQNVVMGTENPLNPAQYVSLVGVKARDPKKQKDAIGMIEFVKRDNGQVEVLFEDGSTIPLGIERIDRKHYGADLQNVVIERNRIPLRRYDVEGMRLNDAAAGAIGG